MIYLSGFDRIEHNLVQAISFPHNEFTQTDTVFDVRFFFQVPVSLSPNDPSSNF